MSETCVLCRMAPGSDRACSQPVCRTCRDQGGSDALEARGCGFEAEMVHRAGNRRRSETFTWTQTFTLPHSSGIQASFTRELLEHRLFKLLPWIEEPQVGDPLFDDHIYVRTGTPDTLAPILAQDTVQSALIELCGLGVVQIHGPTLTTEVITGDQRLQSEFSLPLAMLALTLLEAGG